MFIRSKARIFQSDTHSLRFLGAGSTSFNNNQFNSVWGLKFIIWRKIGNGNQSKFWCLGNFIIKKEAPPIKLGLKLSQNGYFAQIQNIQSYKLTTMSISPLCKITFCINQQQQVKQQAASQQQSTNFIEVCPGVTTRQLAESIGNKLGCGYQGLIEEEIRSELMHILEEGNGLKKNSSEEQVWRSQMQKVLGLTNQIGKSFPNSNKITPQISEKNLKNKYFSNKYDKIFKNKSQKVIGVNNKQNIHDIYDRGMAKKRQREQKISMRKKNKQINEVVQCTFTPNIKDTVEFFNKNRPNFFNQEEKQKQKESTFQRLYKQSFDIKEKRNKRLRTLENQQEAKLSQLSFVPIINECSREICKMKSYASFLSDFEDSNEKHEQKIKNQQSQHKAISKENTVKKSKRMECTFQPEISENTKRLTQHLPNFYDRLQMSKQKKKMKEAQHNQSILSTKAPQKPINPKKLYLKKQVYTIDDGEELQTQKKNKGISELHSRNSHQKQHQQKNRLEETAKVEQKKKSEFEEDRNLSKGKQKQKRSQELFNNRKKTILQSVVAYFTVKPYLKADEFSKKQKKIKKISDDTQINTYDIEENQYIPNFVKQLLQPITSELKDAEIFLSKREFLWAMQKLFEGLSISDKGSLLGWGVKLLPQ